MTAQHRSSILILCAAAVGALLSSCAYDHYGYQSGGSVAYNSNHGSSSSVFIRTSNSRWGYDPTCRSYYDYSRKCYYDPYLNGYYPRGYRPPVVVGVPHPHGWRSGMSVCPPPRNVVHRNISNHRNRYQQYCNLNQSWARNLQRQNHGVNQRTPSHSNSIWNRNQRPPSHSNSIWNRNQDSNHHANNRSSHDNRHTSHPGNSNRTGQSNRNMNPGNSNRTGQSNRNMNPGNSNRNDHSNRSMNPGNSNRIGQSNRNMNPGNSNRTGQSNRNMNPGNSANAQPAVTRKKQDGLRQKKPSSPQRAHDQIALYKQSVQAAKANGSLKKR